MIRRQTILLIALLIVGCEETKDPLATPEPEPYKWSCQADDNFVIIGYPCGEYYTGDSLYSVLWDTEAECEEASCEETPYLIWEDCPAGCTACTTVYEYGICTPDTNGVNL